MCAAKIVLNLLLMYSGSAEQWVCLIWLHLLVVIKHSLVLSLVTVSCNLQEYDRMLRLTLERWMGYFPTFQNGFRYG